MCNKMKRLPIFQGETRQGGANRRLSKQKKEDMMDAYLVAINDVVIDAVSDAIKENNEEQELSLQAVSRTVREIFQDLMVSEKTIQALLDPARRAKRYEEIEGEDLLRQILAEQTDIHFSITSLDKTLCEYDEKRKRDSYLIASETADAVSLILQQSAIEFDKKYERGRQHEKSELAGEIKAYLWSLMLVKWLPLGLLAILNIILTALVLTLK